MARAEFCSSTKLPAFHAQLFIEELKKFKTSPLFKNPVKNLGQEKVEEGVKELRIC